jgi:hypothetical protein
MSIIYCILIVLCSYIVYRTCKKIQRKLLIKQIRKDEERLLSSLIGTKYEKCISKKTLRKLKNISDINPPEDNS